MDLTVKELTKLFNVSEETIHEWIEKKKLPCYKIHNQCKFNKNELSAWAIENNMPVAKEIIDSKKSPDIVSLLKRGGIFYDVKGKTVKEVISNSVLRMHTPPDLDKEKVIDALIKREELMTTAIGRGIALPHPRNPVVTFVENESIAICFLEENVDFNALDQETVHTIFVILSANARRHLEMLAKISFLCHEEDFIKLLQKRADKEEIFNFIKEILP